MGALRGGPTPSSIGRRCSPPSRRSRWCETTLAGSPCTTSARTTARSIKAGSSTLAHPSRPHASCVPTLPAVPPAALRAPRATSRNTQSRSTCVCAFALVRCVFLRARTLDICVSLCGVAPSSCLSAANGHLGQSQCTEWLRSAFHCIPRGEHPGAVATTTPAPMGTPHTHTHTHTHTHARTHTHHARARAPAWACWPRQCVRDAARAFGGERVNLWERQVFDAYPRGAFETDEEEIAPMYSESFRRMVGAYPEVLDQMAAVDESGNTPFHLACLLGLKRLVTELFHADSEADMRLNRIGQTGQPPTPFLARGCPRARNASSRSHARAHRSEPPGPPHASRRHAARLRNRMRAGLRAANHALWSRPRRARSTWRPLPRPWAPLRVAQPPALRHSGTLQQCAGRTWRSRRSASTSSTRSRSSRPRPRRCPTGSTTISFCRNHPFSINRYPYSDYRYPYSDYRYPYSDSRYCPTGSTTTSFCRTHTDPFPTAARTLCLTVV